MFDLIAKSSTNSVDVVGDEPIYFPISDWPAPVVADIFEAHQPILFWLEYSVERDPSPGKCDVRQLDIEMCPMGNWNRLSDQDWKQQEEIEEEMAIQYFCI